MTSKRHVVAVIPARMASTRLPRKLILDKTGKPLICHVVDQTRKAKLITRIIVATDHEEIARAVEKEGAQAVMTRADHPNGTSRIAQVVAGLPAAESEVVVNVQGDEPEIEPALIDRLAQGLMDDQQAPMATLGSFFRPDEDVTNANVVKLIVNQNGHAIYFSRSVIPYDRDKRGPSAVGYLKHPGLYAYRREFLLTYVTLPATPLEQIESLEQLRAIEHGYKIKVVMAESRHQGIDTPEQYEAFVARFKARSQ
jgi:3-deoxy-manno-octulosonate cytidylyltransferase (CMP-KDO synthetase)